MIEVQQSGDNKMKTKKEEVEIKTIEMHPVILERLDIEITQKPKFRYGNGFLEVSNLKIRKGFRYKTLVKKKVEIEKNQTYAICYDKGVWRICEYEKRSGICLYYVRVEDKKEKENELDNKN